MWTPGYWAYSDDTGDYYWVPGAWVPAPYGGALWTPPYWGWYDGHLRFNEGYWGAHVGYYGGVNYGFGFWRHRLCRRRVARRQLCLQHRGRACE